MKHLIFYFFIFSIIFISSAEAQTGNVKGTVQDNVSGETLIGATVRATETMGTVTDRNGNFSLSLPPGHYTLHVSYIGYTAQDKEIDVAEKNIQLSFMLEIKTLGEVKITSDIATVRQNPIAFSQLNEQEIEELRAQQDLPTLLNETPGVFATRQGGGFGDERITIRGVDQTNIGVLVDGLPVNDMESGKVYWSDWLGLGDVTQSIQVQRGLGASKLAISSVGGTINISTLGIQSQPEVRFRQEVGDDGFLKESLLFTTGKMKNGWGITGQGTHVTGNGWTDETWLKQWSYFIKIEKQLGHHLLSASAIGASQMHGEQLDMQNIATYSKSYALKLGDTVGVTQRGLQYNQDWGNIDRFTVISPGDTIHNKSIINAKQNYSYNPQYELKDLWSVSSKIFWSNVLYASTTNSSLTVPNDPYPAIIKSTGQDNFQSIYDYNKFSPLSINPTYSATLHEALGNYLITEATNHVWYGLLSTFNWDINPNWSYTGGLDGRTYQGTHYDQVADLLGANYIADLEDQNQTSAIKVVGDKIGDDYESHIRWAGMFNQLQFHKNKWRIFGTANISDEGFQREDFFAKKDLILPDTTFLQAVGYKNTVTYKGITYNDQSSQAHYSETPWKWIPQYTFKGGINYNIDKHFNIFANAGVFSEAPHFVDIFSTYNQEFVSVKNQFIQSFEAGYGAIYPKWNATINAYYTIWDNQPQYESATYDGNIDYFDIPGVNVLMKGIEFNAKYALTKRITLNIVGSLGDWRYTSADSVRVYDNMGNVVYRSYINQKGVHVGNAAQDQIGGGIRYEIFHNFYVRGQYIYYAKDYSYFTPTSAPENSLDQPVDPWRMPNFGLLSLSAGYKFKVYKKFSLALEGRISNVLNTIYIADADNEKNNDANNALVYMGRGRTYTTTLIITFR